MTTAHIAYIPVIFLLGLLTGTLMSKSNLPLDGKASGFLVSGRALLFSMLLFSFTFATTHFFPISRSVHALHHALNGAEMFDKNPSFHSTEVYGRIATYPPFGIFLYKQFTYTTDLIFPLTLLVFLILLTRYLTERIFIQNRYRTLLLLIPLSWFGFDMVENVMIFKLLDNFPSRNEFLSSTLGYVTTVKFLLLLVSTVMPLFLKVFEKTFNNEIIQNRK